MLLEHIFIGEILKNAWLQHKHIEVLRPQTDDAGYDVVLGCEGIYRHVQLKTKGISAKACSINLNQSLSTPDKSGCVIWIVFNPETIELGPFLWFGGSPGDPLPDISLLPVAKHTKGDSEGVKRERPNIRRVSQTLFESLPTIDLVMSRLFGLSM
ncbi:MAG: hypothetical protein ACIAXF_17290 [Phycisphaerales bacterium JB063]